MILTLGLILWLTFVAVVTIIGFAIYDRIEARHSKGPKPPIRIYSFPPGQLFYDGATPRVIELTVCPNCGYKLGKEIVDLPKLKTLEESQFAGI